MKKILLGLLSIFVFQTSIQAVGDKVIKINEGDYNVYAPTGASATANTIALRKIKGNAVVLEPTDKCPGNQRKGNSKVTIMQNCVHIKGGEYKAQVTSKEALDHLPKSFIKLASVGKRVLFLAPQ